MTIETGFVIVKYFSFFCPAAKKTPGCINDVSSCMITYLAGAVRFKHTIKHSQDSPARLRVQGARIADPWFERLEIGRFKKETTGTASCSLFPFFILTAKTREDTRREEVSHEDRGAAPHKRRNTNPRGGGIRQGREGRGSLKGDLVFCIIGAVCGTAYILIIYPISNEHPHRHPALLNHTCGQKINKTVLFVDQLKGMVLASEYRVDSGPCFLSLNKKDQGLLPAGFLFFLTAKTREGTLRREENPKLQIPNYKQWLQLLLANCQLPTANCPSAPRFALRSTLFISVTSVTSVAKKRSGR